MLRKLFSTARGYKLLVSILTIILALGIVAAANAVTARTDATTGAGIPAAAVESSNTNTGDSAAPPQWGCSCLGEQGVCPQGYTPGACCSEGDQRCPGDYH